MIEITNCMRTANSNHRQFDFHTLITGMLNLYVKTFIAAMLNMNSIKRAVLPEIKEKYFEVDDKN